MARITGVIDRVEERAARYRPKRALLTAIALPVVIPAFVIGGVFRVVWFVGVRLWAAAVIGYELAGGPRRGSP